MSNNGEKKVTYRLETSHHWWMFNSEKEAREAANDFCKGTEISKITTFLDGEEVVDKEVIKLQ